MECFEYIQLGKSFGRDYQTSQLRLDAARLRLSRWGEAANVYHSERSRSEPAEGDLETAAAYFEEIQHLMQGVQRSAKRYQLANPSANTLLASSDDMTLVGNRVHNRATAIAQHRQRSVGTFKKITWALYDGKEFERLVSQIITLIDELEKIFPMEEASRALVEMEIEEIDDVPSLLALEQASQATDPLLSEAVANKLLVVAGSNSADAIATRDQADIQVGHRYSDQVMAQGMNMTDNTRNSAGTINAGGSSKVQIGNRFGGS